MPDVDIDFFDRDGTLKLFKHTPASMIKEPQLAAMSSATLYAQK